LLNEIYFNHLRTTTRNQDFFNRLLEMSTWATRFLLKEVDFLRAGEK